MRKHFLLLFLMAILPLVGWAAPLRSVEALSPYYGEVPTIKVYGESTTPLTAGTDYIFDGFFSAQTCAESEKLTEAEVKAKPAGTTLYVKITGNIGYEGSLTGSFQIKKMPLVILGAFNEGKASKAYGSADPAAPIFAVTKVFKKTVTAFSDENNIKETLGDIFSFTRETGEDAGDYALKAAIANNTLAANYVVESADIYTTLPAEEDVEETEDVDETLGVQAKFVITPKAFTLGSAEPVVAATITITIDDSKLQYNGTNQKPVITVHDIALNKDLVLDTDYTVTYPQTEGDNPQPNHKAAITHNITITGKGNYAATGIPQTFKIAPRPVFVKPVFKKIYDGTADLGTLPAAAGNFITVETETPATTGANAGIYTYKFEFQGIIDAELSTIVFTASALKNSTLTTTQKNVTTEPVALKFVLAENKTINDVFTLANYTFIAQDGTLEITKRPIKVKAASSEVNYGEDESSKLVLADEGEEEDVDAALENAVVADFKALRYILKVTKATTAETTGANAGKYKLTPVWLTDPEIDTKVNAITKETYNALTGANVASVSNDNKKDLKDALKALYKNYEMTQVFGYLKYNKATLYLGLNQSKFTLSKVYDGKEISLDDQLAKLTDAGNLSFSNFQGNDKATDTNILDLSELTMEVVENGAAANTYNLSLSGAKSDFYNISYVNSVYKINPRKLDITTFDQTMLSGQAYSLLNQKAYKITNTKADEGLVDDAEDVFKLIAVTREQVGGVYVYTDNEITQENGGLDADGLLEANNFGIKVADCGADDSKFANYTITVTPGQLTVLLNDGTGLANIMLADDKDVKDQLADVAGADTEENENANRANILFSTRDLKEGVWYTLVLPFDITVADFSKTVGYAIVDKFDEAASDGKVHFNLYMGNIPANTPFMFKLDGQKNNLNQVMFLNKVIVYDPEADNIDEDGNPFIKDGGDNTLVGFYGKKADNKLNAGEYYLNASGAWTPAVNNNVTLGSGRAKLVMGTGSAREILVEEADGSTTAISCIAADGMAVEADGWYTIGGVKLESAPVEKGVYIRNGKKMVIK